MELRKLPTTEDIRNMSFEEFMKFKSPKSQTMCAQELCGANSEWIRVSMLENINSIEELRRLTEQIKEDLWWKIKHQ